MKYKSSLSRAKEGLIHGIFWLIWAYYTLVMIGDHGLEIAVPPMFIATGHVLYVLLFYCSYLLVLPKVFGPFRWKKALLGFICLFLLFCLLRYLTEQVVIWHLFQQRNYPPDTSIAYYLYDNLYYSSQPVILSAVLWSVIYLIRTLEYNAYILQEQKNTEIKFLKAQINPHFIFNTLNNIYSMVYFKSERSLPAIEKLSEIMRFTTYESQKEKISISEEINYINAYIELEQLRHEENDFVRFATTVANGNQEIPPYILSPLVENALKHGLIAAATPIRLYLETGAEGLRFIVENTIGNQKKDKLGGIGLDNLQRRLAIYFPGKYNLDIKTEAGRFVATLTIEW